MLKMVDGTGIIGVDMVCPLGGTVSPPQPPNYDRVELEGTGILVLPNSLNAPLERLELGGKTEQVQTTGKNVWDPNAYTDFGLNENSANSIKYENDIVTYISDNGTYNQIALRIPVGKLREGQYKVSFGKVSCKKKDTGGIESATLGAFSVLKNDDLLINSSTFTVDDPNANYVVKFSGFFSGMHGLLELSIENPMIATTDIDKFEPYTGGKPSPSPEYPQEIKNVGKWNEGTQKYEVDVKVTNAEQNWNKEQTLTITSDRPLTKWDRLVEQGGEIGWLYSTGVYEDIKESDISANSINDQYGRYYVNAIKAYKNAECMCNIAEYSPAQKENKCGFWWSDTLCFLISSEYTGNNGTEDNSTAIKNFKDNVLSKGITVFYKLNTEEFIPLPQSEQNAIRALKTYYPTTVITADGGELDPDIKLTYRKEI